MGEYDHDLICFLPMFPVYSGRGQCYSCGEPGHFAHDCPSRGGANGRGHRARGGRDGQSGINTSLFETVLLLLLLLLFFYHIFLKIEADRNVIFFLQNFKI